MQALTKNELEKCHKLQPKIRAYNKTIEQLKRQASASSAHMKEERIKTYNHTDKMGDTVASYVTLEAVRDEVAAEYKRISGLIKKALPVLESPQQALVVDMYYLRGLKLYEIAYEWKDGNGCSIQNVQQLRNRARRQILDFCNGVV